MKVEFILAYGDGIWETEIVDVPYDELGREIKMGAIGCDEEVDLDAWGRKHFASYKGVLFVGVYNRNLECSDDEYGLDNYINEREVRDEVAGSDE